MTSLPDLYLGYFYPSGLALSPTTPGAPQLQQGVGPMGRTFVQNFVPATLATANIAALQNTVNGTPFTLAAGAGVTAVPAPDGSGATVYQFDVERAVSLTSAANMSAGNVTIVGFDRFGSKLTQRRAGPNANTVNTLKAFLSVLSVTSDTTDAVNTMSVGSSDIFGLFWRCDDAGYIIPKWAEVLAIDAGTFVVADTTNPATNATGDQSGTYKPSSASNGVRRLVIWQHLTGIQCGPNATALGLIGVPQA